MEELSCVAQQYAWGKYGSDSEVARLKQGGDENFVILSQGTYAELWMGTHISGPSRIKSSSESLAEYLLRNPQYVGYNPKDYPNNDLAFLFKVLSIRTALSIQAHPDKKLAAELYTKFPNVYKDGNHKPEMAIALTPFEALCGFRPFPEIKSFLKEYPELTSIIGVKETESFIASCELDENADKRVFLKSLFQSFMQCEDILAATQLQLLISRLKNELKVNAVDELILRLHADFPGDRGALCPLLLNYLTLKTGESFFMGANEPHAYISGDCIECMALSDNVVRAGLTPKFKDVDTLVNMLHFNSGKTSSFIHPVKIDDYTKLYRPPIDVCAEFEVELTTIPAGSKSYSPVSVNCGCLLIVTKGTGSIHTSSSADTSVSQPIKLQPGSCLFVAANLNVFISTEEVEELVFFRAHVNLGHL